MSSNDSVGMQFGPYLLRRRLGTGGMASVWTAIDEAGRAVVVKRILPSLAADAEFVAMFDREATLSSRMRHPNIVRVFDHGDYEGERYLAMEQLHGRDLSSAMMELVGRGAPAPGLGAFVGLEVCRALAYVHGLADDAGAPLHLVHRDVSLSNVMLGFDGSVKLLDFGVAKALADQMTQRTQAGVLKGKWAYLAPEQIEGGALSDQRADLFGLGIVMWEMLTGRRLFKAATGLQTLEKVRAARVLPPSTINPAVPEALDRVVLKALARAPVDRWQSAVEMATALDAVVATLGFGAGELAGELASLFAGEAAAFQAAQQRTPPDGLAPVELAAHDTYDDGLTVPSPRVDPDPPLSPNGATLAELRRPARRVRGLRARAWRMLLAAALASLLGGYTGWQISHAEGAMRAALQHVASR
ncbi:MAG: serine/threonine protein kinase [Polyangia bacterium]